MASIRKQPNGRWKVTYWGPDRRQHSKTFTRKIDADRFAATVESDKLRGSWVDPASSKITLGAWWQIWRATKVDLRPSALARLDSTINTHTCYLSGGDPHYRESATLPFAHGSRG